MEYTQLLKSVIYKFDIFLLLLILTFFGKIDKVIKQIYNNFLPMVVLRRLYALLEPTKDGVFEQ
jgi:hypothetical protein